MMDERTESLLRAWLDGTLPPERAAEVGALLESSAEARRYVEEHEFLWGALEDAYQDVGVLESEVFREATLRRVDSLEPEVPRRRFQALAASVLVMVAFGSWLWWGRPNLDADEREIVRYLHVLQNYELLESFGQELDLVDQIDVLRAFEGELRDEG